MVANVGEILEPEVEEGGEHDGSGFDVKGAGAEGGKK